MHHCQQQTNNKYEPLVNKGNSLLPSILKRGLIPQIQNPKLKGLHEISLIGGIFILFIPHCSNDQASKYSVIHRDVCSCFQSQTQGHDPIIVALGHHIHDPNHLQKNYRCVEGVDPQFENYQFIYFCLGVSTPPHDSLNRGP